MQLTWALIPCLAATVLAHPHPANVAHDHEMATREPGSLNELNDVHAREPYSTVADVVARQESAIQARKESQAKRGLEARDQATITCPVVGCGQHMTVTTYTKMGGKYATCTACQSTLHWQQEGTVHRWVHQQQMKRGEGEVGAGSLAMGV